VACDACDESFAVAAYADGAIIAASASENVERTTYALRRVRE
jgi:hypothetical protein